ncbi:MAG TPA: hypothetical protein VFW19_10780 [Allosphingosinicella sp.]|nr:hypothetical protein [Allosphingosinicella sp.]
MNGPQSPDLPALAREIDPEPVREPWWIRNSDVLAAIACILILIFAGHAVGEF